MARPLRIEYEGAFYHVTSRGNDRKRIYFAASDYAKFRSYLKEAQQKYPVESAAAIEQVYADIKNLNTFINKEIDIIELLGNYWREIFKCSILDFLMYFCLG